MSLKIYGAVIACCVLLGGCATDETGDFQAEETLEEPSFLPEDFDPTGGVQEGALPDRDYSSIQFVGWERHPGKAMQDARKQDRPLLILFTALSWSENARKLGDEVFLSRTFNDFARKELVMSFLDYPQSISSAPESMQMMKERYRITGYPTIVLLDHKGKELWRRSGYVPGKAKDYFEELRGAVEGIPALSD
tara:strand:- start:11413 stop:11991 length:579 start_codon:yes stop_codon:yes gene_type:complete